MRFEGIGGKSPPKRELRAIQDEADLGQLHSPM